MSGLHATTPLPAPAPLPWVPGPTGPARPRAPAGHAQIWAAPREAAAAPVISGLPEADRARRGWHAMAVVCLALAGTLAPAPPVSADTLVATRTIRPAPLIGPQDVALVAETHPGALSDPDEVLGMEARVALYPGRPIRPGDVGPAAVVERNGIVPLIFRRGGLTIHAEGRALGRGAPGETVRVMNLSSRSTVSGVIGDDGSVHVAGSFQRSH